jgi:hypothetical protein
MSQNPQKRDKDSKEEAQNSIEQTSNDASCCSSQSVLTLLFDILKKVKLLYL